MQLQLLLYILLGYFGFFRFSDLIRVALKDVVVSPDNSFMTILLRCSKSDIYSDGQNVVIAANINYRNICPVTLYNVYIARLKLYKGCDNNTLLLKNVNVKANVAMKYERLTALFRKMLTGLVSDTKSYRLLYIVCALGVQQQRAIGG